MISVSNKNQAKKEFFIKFFVSGRFCAWENYIYLYVYIFSRCGGFNPKIVLASVSAIWSKKLLSRKFLSGYYFKIFDTQNFFWEILSQENHFWSLQKTKNKTKATVLAFFLFFFPRIFFSSILFYEIILLFLVHWPEHGRTTRLT